MPLSAPLHAILLAAAPAPAAPQPVLAPSTVTGEPASYETLARLVIDAPLVVDAAVRSTARIRAPEAPGLGGNMTRYYVTADVVALIRGQGAVPARIGFLLDVAADARGGQPNLKRQRMLLFARPVAGRPDQVQLVRPDARLAWNPAIDAQVRGIVREVLDPRAPAAITGLGNAFHVPGALPGEGETQIFLQTATGDPVSLLILRRPGQERRWAVALGDIIDEAGGPPRPATLAWYRLACGLPADLPESSLQSQDPEAARIARDDYRFVRQALGRCDDGTPVAA